MREGVGGLREGRAAVSQTGPGQGHDTCPVPAGVSGTGDLLPPPLLPSHGLSHGPPGGLEALPCHESGHMVEEEGTGEEHRVITFQRNEVRTPLFPI